MIIRIKFNDSKYEKIMFIIGVLVFFLSNTYFGWNKTAQSNAERLFDVIWFCLVFIPLTEMYVKHKIKEVLKNEAEFELK